MDVGVNADAGFPITQGHDQIGGLSADAAQLHQVIDRVRRHLTGEVQDFSDVRYDFSRLPEFACTVLRATLNVKPGHTATYGDLASAIGQPPEASRATRDDSGWNTADPRPTSAAASNTAT